MLIGMMSVEISLFSKSLAKNINQNHGAIAAVPAKDGESLCIASQAKPSQTII